MHKEMKNVIAPTNTDDEIYFNFSYAALKLLGKNLYSNPISAISELVANSFDAGAKNIYVYIDMTKKKESVIEIIDDGTGMDYYELQRKYVWVGRNKREDASEKDRDDSYAVMGRKGIGKLAAFYLSDHYQVYSKTENSSSQEAWVIDLSAYKDSDFPKMDRIKGKYTITNGSIWESFDHGTLLRLDKVDLSGNGEKRIESLQRIFGDYYLTNALEGEIKVFIKTKSNQDVMFKRVEKHIAFANMYAIFDNTDKGYYKNIKNEIEFTWASQYEDIAKKPRRTVVLDKDKYETHGSRLFDKGNGQRVEKEYELKGWIGIHATIETKNALSKNYIRNGIYNPNCLRIYVRNKLAIANYFDVHVNTQAMSNYIEGEVSFDILDDDDLPDIATSSRQDFLEDGRMKLLFSIVDKIVGNLMSVRNLVGGEIRQENSRRIKVEEENRDREQRKEREAREQAERMRRMADEKRIKAEQERNEAKNRQKVAERMAYRERRRGNYISNVSKLDDKSVMNSIHSIYNQTKRVKENLDKVVSSPEYIGVLQKYLLKAEESNQFALIASKNISKAGKSLEGNDASTYVDMVTYVFQYMEQIMMAIYDREDIDIVINPSTAFFEKEIRPLSMGIVLDNIVGNAIKANASKLEVKALQKPDGVDFLFIDDGRGLNSDIDDINRIYEFGYSTTHGSGLGLFYSKKYLNDINCDIDLHNNSDRGVTATVRVRSR